MFFTFTIERMMFILKKLSLGTEQTKAQRMNVTLTSRYKQVTQHNTTHDKGRARQNGKAREDTKNKTRPRADQERPEQSRTEQEKTRKRPGKEDRWDLTSIL